MISNIDSFTTKWNGACIIWLQENCQSIKCQFQFRAQSNKYGTDWFDGTFPFENSEKKKFDTFISSKLGSVILLTFWVFLLFHGRIQILLRIHSSSRRLFVLLAKRKANYEIHWLFHSWLLLRKHVQMHMILSPCKPWDTKQTTSYAEVA